MNKIKLLMLAPSADMGGAEKSLIFLASRIKMNDRFDLRIGIPKGKFSETIAKISKNVFQLVRFETPIHTNKLTSILRLPWYIFALLSNIIIIMLNILHQKSDVVFVNNSTMLSANIASFILKRRVVTFVREDYYYDQIRWRERLFWFLSSTSKMIICSNNDIKKALLKYKPLNTIRILYDGAYDLPSESVKKSILKKGSEFRMGMVGALYPLKGQDIFIRSIAELKKTMPNIKGVLYGISRRPYYLNKLKRLSFEFGVNDNVIFYGGETDLSKIYGSIDALVIASWNEGFSMVFAEALRMKVPVISTPVGVMADLGVEGKNILFFDPGDYVGLAEKIKQIIGSVELRMRLIENGSQLYADYLNPRRIATRFLEIIEESEN